MTLVSASAARSLASRAPVRQPSMRTRRRMNAPAIEAHAGAGLGGVRAVAFDHVRHRSRGARQAGDHGFEIRQLVSLVAAVASLGIPGGMAVVAVDQLGADAADFAGGARGLHVAEVGEEVGEPGRPSASAGFSGPFASSSSTSRIWQREASSQQSASASGNVTPWRRLVVELRAVGVGGLLQVARASRATSPWRWPACRRRCPAAWRRSRASRRSSGGTAPGTPRWSW